MIENHFIIGNHTINIEPFCPHRMSIYYSPYSSEDWITDIKRYCQLNWILLMFHWFFLNVSLSDMMFFSHGFFYCIRNILSTTKRELIWHTQKKKYENNWVFCETVLDTKLAKSTILVKNLVSKTCHFLQPQKCMQTWHLRTNKKQHFCQI